MTAPTCRCWWYDLWYLMWRSVVAVIRETLSSVCFFTCNGCRAFFLHFVLYFVRLMFSSFVQNGDSLCKWFDGWIWRKVRSSSWLLWNGSINTRAPPLFYYLYSCSTLSHTKWLTGFYAWADSQQETLLIFFLRFLLLYFRKLTRAHTKRWDSPSCPQSI